MVFFLEKEVVLALGSAGLLYVYVGHPGVVQGSSMMPTFPACCSVVWFSSVFKTESLKRGDIVSATSPGNPESSVGIVKRIRGLPGDLVLNDSLNILVEVPKDHVYLLGDNSQESHDSRAFGPIPMSMIKAKVTHQLFPSIKRVPSLPQSEMDRVWVGHTGRVIFAQKIDKNSHV